jgi:protein-arginine kinase activator protein McsA
MVKFTFHYRIKYKAAYQNIRKRNDRLRNKQQFEYAAVIKDEIRKLKEMLG